MTLPSPHLPIPNYKVEAILLLCCFYFLFAFIPTIATLVETLINSHHQVSLSLPCLLPNSTFHYQESAWYEKVENTL